ncbi:MAG: hypothetical protein GXX85_14270 [Ignavibacteria bacterium]|nr:hypothetical protein [Ignavibacteria bacterium]
MKIVFEIQFEVLNVDEIGETLREASLDNYIMDDGIRNVINSMKDDYVESRKAIIEDIIDKIYMEFGTECDDLQLFNFCHFESFFDVYADTEEELDKLEDKVKQYLNNLDKEYEDILEINYYVSDRGLEEEKD